jgi:pilus assembly protein Flp/PilA
MFAEHDDDRTEDGASAVEYGLLVAAIAALIAILVFSLGGVLRDLFGTSCGTVAGEIVSASCGP